MYIKPSIFKKLVKKAYEATGIYLANRNGTVIIAGSNWIINVKENEIPNKIKAIIIEFTGFIPKAGDEECSISKYGIQMEIPNDELLLNEAWTGLKKKTHRTPVYINTMYKLTRVYQCDYDFMVDNMLDNLVSTADTEEYETAPDGPYMTSDNKIIYSNESMKLAHTIVHPDDDTMQEEILEAIRKVDLGGANE